MASAVLHIPIDKAGRVVLPKEIRDRMGLPAGTEFEVIEEKDRIILKPVEKQPKLIRKGSFLVFMPDESPKDVDIVDLIKKDREDRIHKKMGLP